MLTFLTSSLFLMYGTFLLCLSKSLLTLISLLNLQHLFISHLSLQHLEIRVLLGHP
jgi:hypothetical protein